MCEREAQQTRLLQMKTLSLGAEEMAEQLRAHCTVVQTHENAHTD